MRRWIALAARLYPRSWRERYGDEFDALVEDATADWRQLLNVTRSAITMQVSDHIREIKLAGALMLAGALLAIAASYRVPERYVSSAVLRMTPVVDAGKRAAPDVLQRVTEDRIHFLTLELTGRDNTLRILQLSELNLYPRERDQEPLEDLAERIRNGDLRVLPVVSSGVSGSAFRVSFAYPDKAKARAVVQELVGQLQRDNDASNHEIASAWRELWSEAIPFSERVDVVQYASLPSSPAQPQRTIFAAVGTAAGLLVGILAVLFWRRPQFGLRIAVCGLAGCAVGCGISLLISEKYTARAVLRMTAPFTPKQLSGELASPSVGEWMRRLRTQVLSADNVAQIARSPNFRLDSEGMAAILKAPDQVFHISVLDPSSEAGAIPSIEITVAHPDKVLARKLAMELVAEIQARYIGVRASMDQQADEQLRFAHEHHAGDKLVIVTQPNLDDELATHYRLQLTIAGAVMGILLAIARWSAPAIAHP